MTQSRTSLHFDIVGPMLRSQLHMAGASITFSDCIVLWRDSFVHVLPSVRPSFHSSVRHSVHGLAGLGSS